jgi:methionine-gamma-lyase
VLAGSVSCDVPLYLKLRHLRTHLGCVPGNLECFLLLRSLKTLVLRVVQQARNARAVCDALARHPNVESVLNGAVTEPKTWAQVRRISSVVFRKTFVLFRCILLCHSFLLLAE